MRKLIVLVALSLITLQGITQAPTVSSKDITCLPNSALREGMRLNEIRKVQAKELALYKQRVNILDSIIAARDQFVINSAKKDATYEKQIFAFNSAITTLKQQQKVYTDWVGDLDKQLTQAKSDLSKKQWELDRANRRRKNNKIFYGVGSAIATAALFIVVSK